MKIGMGYDIHRLVEGRKMVIGGVTIPHSKGAQGHSDGDVLLHAICDAVLGAMGKEDIGMYFPDTDPKYIDIPSREFLLDVAKIADMEHFKISNVDCIVIAQEPKIAPYREEIIRVVSTILAVSESAVNVKGKTSEEVGAIGEGNAIAAYAVALLEEGK